MTCKDCKGEMEDLGTIGYSRTGKDGKDEHAQTHLWRCKKCNKRDDVDDCKCMSDTCVNNRKFHEDNK